MSLAYIAILQFKVHEIESIVYFVVLGYLFFHFFHEIGVF